MFSPRRFSLSRGGAAFVIAFGLCVCLGVVLSFARPAAAPSPVSSAHSKEFLIQATAQVSSTGEYRGPELCSGCHKDIHTEWSTTLHSKAFSSPIFQEAWTKDPNKNACLQFHTTGYNPADGTYKFEGVTCESCHGGTVSVRGRSKAELGSMPVPAVMELLRKDTHKRCRHYKPVTQRCPIVK